MKTTKILLCVVVMACVVLAQPAVKLTADTTTIRVEYLRGQFDYACTVYTSETERIMLDGVEQPYAPRHCWFLDKSKGSYEDNWDYVKPNGGTWDVQALLWDTESKAEGVTGASNVVKVVR